MKKYEMFVQNKGSLQRKFIAGSLAAVFGAGAFGGYAAAMKENIKEDESQLKNSNQVLQIEDNLQDTEIEKDFQTAIKIVESKMLLSEGLLKYLCDKKNFLIKLFGKYKSEFHSEQFEGKFGITYNLPSHSVFVFLFLFELIKENFEGITSNYDNEKIDIEAFLKVCLESKSNFDGMAERACENFLTKISNPVKNNEVLKEKVPIFKGNKLLIIFAVVVIIVSLLLIIIFYKKQQQKCNRK